MTDTTTLASAAFAAFEHADWHGLQQALTWCTCWRMHGEMRSTSMWQATCSLSKGDAGIWWHNNAPPYPVLGVRALLMTWFEVCNDPAAAQARANEIRRWTHAWQRRLVETLNPQWLDLAAYALGFPGKLAQVGERQVQFSTILNSGDT